MHDLNACTIDESNSIQEALQKIEINSLGLVLTVNSHSKIVGICTDGDIRRRLILNNNLNAEISTCANPHFVYVEEGVSREGILKKLNRQIRVIPVLDSNGRLIDIVSREGLYDIDSVNQLALVRARAPVRVSFAGGGSDMTQFFIKHKGAVISTGINLYCHATVGRRSDEKISIISKDTDQTFVFSSITDLKANMDTASLFRALVEVINPDFGFDLIVESDFSIKSGLGGSSAVCAAVIGCFNEFRKFKMDQYGIAELSFLCERLHLGIEGGWQDQYATVFGGFNFMEFSENRNLVCPLRLTAPTLLELERSLVICDLKSSRDSGIIQSSLLTNSNCKNSDLAKTNSVNLAYEMRDCLLRSNIENFGHLLHKAWINKRNFGENVSNPFIDDIYNGALDHGALGGKLLGAGGGGHFLFFAPPAHRSKLLSYLASMKLEPIRFGFENDGLQTWSVPQLNHAAAGAHRFEVNSG